MDALRWFALGVGIVLVASVGVSVLRALVVPRPPSRRSAISLVSRLIRRGFRSLAGFRRTYEAQDRLLAMAQPVGVVVVLAIWMGAALLGYALILWRIPPYSLPAALTEAGSSMFTLGFAAHGGGVARLVDFLAAGTGLVVIALQIAYLPTLYGAFNRREQLVTMLESRAGIPAWGPELLARHQLISTVDELPSLYAAWEAWAADLAETHSTYPSLLFLRSPRRHSSWIVALVAVLDSAALLLAFNPSSAPSQARHCLRMGFTALRDVATTVGIDFDPDPAPSDPILLEEDEFREAAAILRTIGFPLERTDAEAWPHFRGWRVNYEAIAYEIAARVLAPAAPWTGPRPVLVPVPVAPRRPVDRRPESPGGLASGAHGAHEPADREPTRGEPTGDDGVIGGADTRTGGEAPG